MTDPHHLPHPTSWVLRVENGRGSITPPESVSHEAPEDTADEDRRPPLQLVRAQVCHGRPPGPSERVREPRVYVYERYPGFTTIEALDQRGSLVCELSIHNDIANIGEDIEAVRSRLEERVGITRLSVL